jgi:hypothetical protein
MKSPVRFQADDESALLEACERWQMEVTLKVSRRRSNPTPLRSSRLSVCSSRPARTWPDLDLPLLSMLRLATNHPFLLPFAAHCMRGMHPDTHGLRVNATNVTYAKRGMIPHSSSPPRYLRELCTTRSYCAMGSHHPPSLCCLHG